MSSECPEPAPVQVAASWAPDSAAPSDVPQVDAIAPPLTSPPLTSPPLTSPTIMSQRWCDLAFLHWFVPPARVQSWMPPGATPDVVPRGRFAGLTPVALVPFRMVDAGFGRGPAVPYFGTFWETNVRLYSIDATGTHGIVFCSLDASRLAVVLAARLALGLPYRFSRMRGYQRTRDGIREVAWTASTRWPGRYGTSSRVAIRVGKHLLATAQHQPEGSESGKTSCDSSSLVTFLTARGGLHTAVWGRTMYVPNVHETWILRSAEVLLLEDGFWAPRDSGTWQRGRPITCASRRACPLSSACRESCTTAEKCTACRCRTAAPSRPAAAEKGPRSVGQTGPERVPLTDQRGTAHPAPRLHLRRNKDEKER